MKNIQITVNEDAKSFGPFFDQNGFNFETERQEPEGHPCYKRGPHFKGPHFKGPRGEHHKDKHAMKLFRKFIKAYKDESSSSSEGIKEAKPVITNFAGDLAKVDKE